MGEPSTPTDAASSGDECPVCGERMLPGQRRGQLDDGTKVHAGCAETRNVLTDPHLTMEQFNEAFDLRQEEAAIETRSVIDRLVNERIAEAVAAATKDAIPNKSTALRRLMTHAADGLDGWVKLETSKPSYSQMSPGVVAAMVEAATVLRTVAIYVSDDEPAAPGEGDTRRGAGRSDQ